MNIKVYRMINNMKQSELAKELGVTTTTMSKYENNIGKMPLETVVKASKLLGVTPNDLAKEIMEEETE